MAASPGRSSQVSPGGKHVAIIGAGIVGIATAIWLQRGGHRVTVIDRKGPGEATSFGNGGVLASAAIVPVTVPGLLRKAPGMLLDRDQPLFLRPSYLPKLLPWLARYLSHANAAEARRIATALAPIIGDSVSDHQALAAGSGAERYIHPCDYTYLYDSRAGYEADRFSWDIRAAHGFRWDILDAAEWQRAAPVFSPDLGCAIRLPGHGRISDPGAYVKALAAHVMAEGGQVIRAEFERLIEDGGAVCAVRAGGTQLPCDAVVLATGAWSKPLTRALGLDIALESERGYHLELWAPSAMPPGPVMIAARKFVVTPMEGRIRLAGIVEFGGLDAGPSEAPLDLLRRHARAAMPGLSWVREEVWMGHRPAPADSIPLIGAVPGISGAYLGFGHHHIGLTGGPKTGRLLAQLISGQTPNQDMTAYAPARYARAYSAQ